LRSVTALTKEPFTIIWAPITGSASFEKIVPMAEGWGSMDAIVADNVARKAYIEKSMIVNIILIIRSCDS
jgi:hypothetical protein